MNPVRIVWNEQSARWFRSASEYTGYNRKLAALLREELPPGGTLCDLGCGTGLIDFELAGYLKEITCVDISPQAIRMVEEEIRRQGVGNLTALCADADTLEGKWDTVLALFHGGAEVFSRYVRLAGERMILAVHGSLRGHFGPENRRVVKCFDVQGVRKHLDELGVRYHLLQVALEHGQPLTDLQDSQAFVTAYALPMEASELDAYLRENLQTTGDAQYPYYLPKRREIGLFFIHREENAALWERLAQTPGTPCAP